MDYDQVIEQQYHPENFHPASCDLCATPIDIDEAYRVLVEDEYYHLCAICADEV